MSDVHRPKKFLTDFKITLILCQVGYMILRLEPELYRLFSSGQKIQLYWKCPSDTKMVKFVDSIDE